MLSAYRHGYISASTNWNDTHKGKKGSLELEVNVRALLVALFMYEDGRFNATEIAEYVQMRVFRGAHVRVDVRTNLRKHVEAYSWIIVIIEILGHENHICLILILIAVVTHSVVPLHPMKSRLCIADEIPEVSAHILYGMHREIAAGTDEASPVQSSIKWGHVRWPQNVTITPQSWEVNGKLTEYFAKWQFKIGEELKSTKPNTDSLRRAFDVINSEFEWNTEFGIDLEKRAYLAMTRRACANVAGDMLILYLTTLSENDRKKCADISDAFVHFAKIFVRASDGNVDGVLKYWSLADGKRIRPLIRGSSLRDEHERSNPAELDELVRQASDMSLEQEGDEEEKDPAKNKSSTRMARQKVSGRSRFAPAAAEEEGTS